MSPAIAQDVIKTTWEETVAIFESLLLPPLYGTIDATRRLLNKRQISMAKECMKILYDFFHADGEGLGLSAETLATPLYNICQNLIKTYSSGFDRLKKDYEVSVMAGKEKEWVLRLIRLYIEKDSSLEDKKEWFALALTKRKEIGRR